MLGALTFGMKVAMAGLPNIEPVSLMVMLFAVVFGWKALYPVYLYVLLEVLLFARIAEEQGLFSVDDVIQGISEKMIRRHPHVFGDKTKPAPSWEEIKRLEKEQKKQRKLAKNLDK